MVEIKKVEFDPNKYEEFSENFLPASFIDTLSEKIPYKIETPVLLAIMDKLKKIIEIQFQTQLEFDYIRPLERTITSPDYSWLYDEIIVIFDKGDRFSYEVINKNEVSLEEISTIANRYKDKKYAFAWFSNFFFERFDTSKGGGYAGFFLFILYDIKNDYVIGYVPMPIHYILASIYENPKLLQRLQNNFASQLSLFYVGALQSMLQIEDYFSKFPNSSAVFFPLVAPYPFHTIITWVSLLLKQKELDSKISIVNLPDKFKINLKNFLLFGKTFSSTETKVGTLIPTKDRDSYLIRMFFSDEEKYDIPFLLRIKEDPRIRVVHIDFELHDKRKKYFNSVPTKLLSHFKIDISNFSKLDTLLFLSAWILDDSLKQSNILGIEELEKDKFLNAFLKGLEHTSKESSTLTDVQKDMRNHAKLLELIKGNFPPDFLSFIDIANKSFSNNIDLNEKIWELMKELFENASTIVEKTNNIDEINNHLIRISKDSLQELQDLLKT